ncbi:hypothetical protein [Nostoc sp. JL33]|nr:hypothetical protein [Nostoc sp. JL33]
MKQSLLQLVSVSVTRFIKKGSSAGGSYAEGNKGLRPPLNFDSVV